MAVKPKKTDGLLFRFTLIFAIFTVVTLLTTGISTYVNQTRIYLAECQKNLQNVVHYLANLISLEGEEFLWYQDYMIAHGTELKIPMDFEGYEEAKQHYEELLAAEYPGQTVGEDIPFEELSEECKAAFAIYKHEYWLTIFEQARPDFGIAYTYYVMPTGEPHHMYYMLDAMREAWEDDPENIHLMIDVGYVGYEDTMEMHKYLWDTWNTGKDPEGFDIYDNEFGQDFGFYTPVFVNGKKIGVACAEIEIAKVNQGILLNTLRQLLTIAVILILAVIAVLWFINHFYIKKIEHLAANVRQYAEDKEALVAMEIEQENHGGDEISALANQTAAMILELDNYMKNLVATTRELSETKKQATVMHEMANRDALTGIRNKNAYDNEVKKLEWKIEEGDAEFGIAMIDLNFLKRINDTYGHEHGNVAIKRLCQLVCTVFEHSPVFRIGGDEFVVILENTDLKNVDELVKTFNKNLEEMQKDDSLEVWEKVSAAIGVAFYDPDTDGNVANVFKRADRIMYQNKKEMKAVREF